MVLHTAHLVEFSENDIQLLYDGFILAQQLRYTCSTIAQRLHKTRFSCTATYFTQTQIFT